MMQPTTESYRLPPHLLESALDSLPARLVTIDRVDLPTAAMKDMEKPSLRFGNR